MGPSNKKTYRKRRTSSSDDDASDAELEATRKGISEALEAQKYRRRARGVDAEALLRGDSKASDDEEERKPDTIESRINSGGGLVKASAAAKSLDMAGFSTERQRVPTEDKHLKKYIEQELARRQGLGRAGQGKEEEEDAYYESEEFKKMREQQEKEETMTGAMLSGIPEVDLGIEVKMKNIEETEKAKQVLLGKAQARGGAGVDASNQYRCPAPATASDDRAVDAFRKRQRRY